MIKFKKTTDKDTSKHAECWNILVVDDEVEVHRVTKYAIDELELDGKGINFISTYEEESAKEILRKRDDIAVILLDVVMDKKDSGLEIVKFIREELGNRSIRIILRTGQPGAAPEDEVILKYDINDYANKAELTQKRLTISIISALRSYRDIKKIAEIDSMLLQRSKMADMGEMLRVITHQLNQPISAISLLSYSIEDILDLQEEIDRDELINISEQIQKQSQFMSETILVFKSFLRPSKIKKRFCIKESIEFILGILKPIFVEKHISINLNAPEEKIFVEGYESELKHVLLNIINNAIDSVVENSKGPNFIDINIKKDGATIEIEMLDSGGGIPEEMLGKIFKYGFSTKEDRGTGIGLYLAKKIVESHDGGKIKVENRKSGACFSISLLSAQESE